ncbi:MAG: ABC transporter ATP-binding protein [Gemmatimonadetes bacterium]|nr:ABC transporter ATP-binding protein [Gemmatimonadota bacterium]
MHRLGRLLAYGRRHWVLFAVGLIAAVVASTLDGLTFALLIPFLRSWFGLGAAPGVATGVERVLDFLLARTFGAAEGRAALYHVALLMLAAVVIKNLASYFAAYCGARIQEAVAGDLRRDLYAHVQRLGLAFYHRTRGGQLLARMLADPDQARLVVSQALVSALQNGTLVLVYLAIMLSLSWKLALLALALAPALALALRPVLVGIRARSHKVLDDRGEMAAAMAEATEGARLIKAHAAESYERRRFDAHLQRYSKGALDVQRLAALAHPLSEVLGAVVLVALLLLGATGLPGGAELRPELYIAFLAVTLRLLPPVKALSQFPTQAAMALAAAERVFEVLDLPPDDVDPPATRAFPGFQRDIVFDGVWFAYEPGAWVLRDLNLRMARSEVVAIVGASGAGKSTLVDLLPRFVDPTRGAVLIDGVPTTSWSRRSLRRALGIVSQQNMIFHDTVRANIAYGGETGAGTAAIEAAARAANAHEFIQRLPQGYATVLGERGARLSGGERQRIALARAILRDPPILILDEATSALDPESERLVQDAIQRLLRHRTVLVIAHRLATVMTADRIVVLDGGRVVEEGRHGELVAAEGVYQQLHALELAGRGG